MRLRLRVLISLFVCFLSFLHTCCCGHRRYHFMPTVGAIRGRLYHLRKRDFGFSFVRLSTQTFIRSFILLLALLQICRCRCNRYHFKPTSLTAPGRFVGEEQGRLSFRVTVDTYFFLASAILVFICASALASDASP